MFIPTFTNRINFRELNCHNSINIVKIVYTLQFMYMCVWFLIQSTYSEIPYWNINKDTLFLETESIWENEVGNVWYDDRNANENYTLLWGFYFCFKTSNIRWLLHNYNVCEFHFLRYIILQYVKQPLSELLL